MPSDADRSVDLRSEQLRQDYLAAARLVVDLVAHPAVVATWDDPSSLPGMTVGELAAHVGRSVLQVEAFLDGPDPGWAQPITAGSYYALLQDTTDLDSALNVGVRQRAVEVAVHGPDGVLARVSSCAERLSGRLPTEPVDRQLIPHGDRALTLDDYLRTRLVEICVHHHDLATGLPDTPLPRPAAEAVTAAVDVLVAAARERHGDRAVLLALSRREHDHVEALRVL